MQTVVLERLPDRVDDPLEAHKHLLPLVTVLEALVSNAVAHEAVVEAWVYGHALLTQLTRFVALRRDFTGELEPALHRLLVENLRVNVANLFVFQVGIAAVAGGSLVIGCRWFLDLLFLLILILLLNVAIGVLVRATIPPCFRTLSFVHKALGRLVS